MCACVWERDGERESERERARAKKSKRRRPLCPQLCDPYPDPLTVVRYQREREREREDPLQRETLTKIHTAAIHRFTRGRKRRER